RRRQAVHVLQPLGHHHTWGRAIHPRPGDQPLGRRGARPDGAGEPELSALLEVSGLDVRILLLAGVLHPVREVSLAVAAGETLCVVGESGCGKSLTSLAIMNLLPKRA